MTKGNVGIWDQFGEAYDFPPFRGKPKLYLIASTPRSGSHFLGHLLFATGMLGTPLEYLHPDHFERWKSKLGATTTAGTFEKLFALRTSPSGWFGMKSHWPEFWDRCERDDLDKFLDFSQYIKIVRRDEIAQAVSLAMAAQTGKWISFHPDSSVIPAYNFSVITDSLTRVRSDMQNWSTYFSRRNITSIEIAYEDLIASPISTAKTVGRHFGLDISEDKIDETKLPARQANELNVEWKNRYLEDLRQRNLGRR